MSLLISGMRKLSPDGRSDFFPTSRGHITQIMEEKSFKFSLKFKQSIPENTPTVEEDCAIWSKAPKPLPTKVTLWWQCHLQKGVHKTPQIFRDLVCKNVRSDFKNCCQRQIFADNEECRWILFFKNTKFCCENQFNVLILTFNIMKCTFLLKTWLQYLQALELFGFTKHTSDLCYFPEINTMGLYF